MPLVIESAVSIIAVTPGVCGGEPYLASSRIPVRLLVEARRMGMADSALLVAYPMLTAEVLRAVWQYHETHQAEIERLISENCEA